MDDFGIEHHKVDPEELQQRADDGKIPSGTKFVATAMNSSFPEVIQDVKEYHHATGKMNWSYFGLHTFEMMYQAEENGWLVYNYDSNKNVANSYDGLENLAGHKLDQFVAIYEVSE
jgi:hypothetical protein